MTVDAWPRAADDAIAEVSEGATNSGTRVFVANGHSLLCCLSAVTGIAQAAADKLSVELQNCHDARAILAGLPSCAQRSLFAIAQWQEDDELHIATVAPNRNAPDYRRLVGKSLNLQLGGKPDERQLTTVRLACFRNQIGFDAALSDALQHNVDQTILISAADIAAQYNDSLMRGISVAPAAVRMLTMSADAVLVESTEQSRLGAGE